jgi:3-oxoacyl-[acyl-carrier-protein] synthase-3
MSIGIVGFGNALGSRTETNEELCLTLTSITPEWIVEKTGITQRHKVLEHIEDTVVLARAAALRAMWLDIKPDDIGMIVVCSFTNDYHFPSIAARVARDIGAHPKQAYDLNANCSGFISALVAVSDRMKADPSIKYSLVIGAEVLSPYIDPTDPNTAPFFSDGAGAVVLHYSSEDRGSSEYGIVSSAFSMDTSNYESVRCLRGGKIEQQGLATWSQATKHLPGVIREAVSRAGWRLEDVDVFIPHQANLVLLEFLAGRLGLKDKMFANVATTGNCGAASIPIAIADAMAAGRLHSGDKVVLAGIGAGFSFAALCMEWA